MPAVVSNATRIWETEIYWDLYAQCGIWDPKGKGVDIWECVRAHHSTHSTQPPNSTYWSGRTRRPSLAIREIPPPVSFPVATRFIAGVLQMPKSGTESSPDPCPFKTEYDGDRRAGCWNPGSSSGVCL